MTTALGTFMRDGLVFDVLEGGPDDGEGVILLHGFPESAAAYDGITPALNAGGYRTFAPDQRGYSPGARPLDRRAYRVPALVDDVLALADARGLDRFHLVGHDWGGFVAWALATRPEGAARLRSLSVLSTPHPSALTRSFFTSTQALHFWYMGMFQIPRLPERLWLAVGARAMRKGLRDSGMPAAWVDRYATRMQEPGALTAAINWYRANLRPSMRKLFGPIRVPTLYVWSTEDVALVRAPAEGTARYVEAAYRFEVLDGTSHWIPEEASTEVAALLLDHLGAN
ncbi:MAG TPA: alpha/beta fold hydrolase [Acidimicrobiales bacterium]|nr:alpha/beta fold hydrolase [Acidimicrobiales bacterium]